ncbi:MAG: DbpA RNA binding domain-containing protein [Treponema sp.]|nr:DbpA RNA binding domain-containing protein [Treponema sp.]
MNSRIDIEKTRRVVAQITEKIKSEVDPWLLDEYHALFKKEVSLFHRSRVAAYLLMLVEQGKGPRLLDQNAFGQRRNGPAKPEKNGSRRAKTGGPATGDGPGTDPQRYPLADKDSKWLFFSVGRSRRVSPREILSLLNTKTAIPKDDIGAIRIFDNYSFVQVRDTVAEAIIEALNEYVFRGRPLVVNYAKSKKDEEGDATEDSAESSPDDSDQQEKDQPQEEDV